MTQAKNGDTVKVHYKGKLKDGEIFDTSEGREPIKFTLGNGELIPGFEKAVLGMEPGESRTTEIASDEAYGPRFEEKVVEIEKERLPEHLNPEPGQKLQVQRDSGETVIMTVTDVSESSVTLDMNHPLAGEDLFFEIELVEIMS